MVVGNKVVAVVEMEDLVIQAMDSYQSLAPILKLL
jgi:hypothetical protein